MKGTNLARLALAVLAVAGSAQAQGTLFYDDFESGLEKWETTALWHRETSTTNCSSQFAPFPSGQFAARYGVESSWSCSIGNSSSQGRLVTRFPVDIPATASAVTLSFETMESTECFGPNCGWDERFVHVSGDGGANWTLVAEGGPEGVWRHVDVDLSTYAGQSILVRFRFDTVDGQWNDFPGWYLDNVRITAEYAASYCTAKINSLGCVPTLAYAGLPSLSAGQPLQVSVSDILNRRSANLIWSRSPGAMPFQGGTLCVQIPAARTPVDSSGGSPAPVVDCSGAYVFDFTPSYLASKSVLAGQTLHIQFSGRDPGFAAPNNRSLSAGLAVTILP